ncbi:polysaccharide deacetylase family protein [Kocuria sp. LUK]|uniref:polysaccharide deacetylase family protein n=1 Tax=Kocuria sp. LUK TaxID=2897828 RepID=UPI001E29129A|nr:polysaccharide deacetylase family protein [Kocuria sp. LUK]MCD1144985.1 polysaccharide deacetylase family protein [Kocuria sp. LUK]
MVGGIRSVAGGTGYVIAGLRREQTLRGHEGLSWNMASIQHPGTRRSSPNALGIGEKLSPQLIPVLLYHAVTENPGRLIAPFAVTPQVFEQHLGILREEQYTCVTFSQLLDSLAAGTVSPRTAVITFDDGYKDFADNALPALQSHAYAATTYLTTGFLAGSKLHHKEPGPADPMLDWAQLPELVASGIEIGAHSHSHPQMDTLTAAQLRRETYLPKALLEDALGVGVRSFAYPHGYNGPRVRRFTRDAGYDNAAGVRNAFTHSNNDPFNVARLMLQSHHSLGTFRNWLRGSEAPIETQGESLKTKLWRDYRRGKAILRRRPGSEYQ